MLKHISAIPILLIALSGCNVEIDGDNISVTGTPPVITSVQVSDVTATTATVTFVTNENATTEINYADDNYYTANSTYNQSAQVPGYATTHSVVLGNLSPATTYYYQIVSADSDSNKTTLGGQSFATHAPDTVAPVISNPTPAQSSLLQSGTTSIQLGVTTDEPANCRYSVTANTTYDSMTNDFSATASILHATTLSGLADGNAYTYYIRCQDTSGNASTSDYVVGFSIDTPGPVNHDPVLNALADIVVTEGETITFTPSATDQDQDTLTFSYSGWMTASQYTTQAGDAGTHAVTVTVEDAHGGSDSQVVTVTINPAPGDTDPPVRSAGGPSGTLAAGTTEATLSLTTDEDATCRYSTTAASSYASMTDTFSTTGGTSHSHLISGLNNGASYTYYVRCQDGTGNTNADDYPISFSVDTGGSAALPAFPGAEGFGSTTVGGRGGAIYKVTNLNDNGPGSFRAAVETYPRHYPDGGGYTYESIETYHARLESQGHRIIVFEVSGIINLVNEIMMKIPYMTIAGETSPGGILVTGRQVSINTHDVIMRHMRFRVGSHRITDGTGADAETLDSFDLYGNAMMNWYNGPGASNVIIDHCSFSWGVDETFTATTGAKNFTVQRSIFAEGLNNAGHDKQNHSKGVLFGLEYGGVTNASFHHNYIVSNYDRSPLVSGEGSGTPGEQWVDIRNNVVYNFYGGTAMEAQQNGAGNWVHNYVKRGPESNGFAYEMSFLSPAPDANHLLYVEGNLGTARLSQSDPQWCVADFWHDYLITTDYQKSTPYDNTGGEVTTEIASLGMAEAILLDVGATQPTRDSVDTRVIADFANDTGAIPDNVVYPDDFPTFQDPAPPMDSDNDGMPDSWETANGLNTAVNDSALDADNDGYTNIEEYLHHAAANGPVQN